MHPYLLSKKPHILAHQGLALTSAPNTVEAFSAALTAGADYIETDAHGTRDGVAVLFHDALYEGKSIHSYNRDELPVFIPSLSEALHQFPDARFNIDIKSNSAIEPVAAALNDASAHKRVLLTSFSARRRKRTSRAASGTALSPATSELALIYLLNAIGAKQTAIRKLSKFDAVQIPRKAYGISTLTTSRMSLYRAAEVVVHVWTINNVEEMRELVALGVDGIVTDMTHIARQAL